MPILSRRRLLVVAAIWPHVGIGQPRTGARRLVFLSVAPVEQAAQPFADAFYEQLARLGWERGHNLLVEGRYGAGDPARAELLARELLDFQPDVLVAGTDDAARAAARVAPTLPIVFINGYDPIGNGLVASLALPGAHATGILVQGPQVSAKRLALLKEAMPDLERAAVLVHRDADASLRTQIVELEASGRKLGIVVSSVRVDGPDDLAPAFAALARQRVRGLMHLYPFVHPFIARNLQTLGQLALEHRIALMANSTLVAGTHELLAYGVNVPALSQPAARLVDRLLRGESPATMPVERAQVFDLVVNLHTAHALGVEVPRSVRRQATRVIEFAKLPRIGILDLGYGIYPALERALLQLGYVNGKNVFYDPRFADGKPERLAVLADELVRDHVDVIVAASHNAAFAARKATNRIPIVVRASHNGVKMGLYSTLARPGGNLTGVDALAPELDAKRAELLKQTVPGLSQLAVLLNPADRSSSVHLKYVHAAAKALAIGVEPLEVASAAELDAVLARAARALPKALLIFTDEVTDASIGHVAEFAIKHAIPTMCEFRHQAQAGCLISYGPSTDEFDAIAARQIDKILKGAKAGDLPVQQVTRYELVINQKVARAVGVTIPRALLAAATAVIE